MYLARKKTGRQVHYCIRESYAAGDQMLCRDLFDLGGNPAEYIIYPGGNAYYIDDLVEENLQSQGARPCGDDLDNIFWPFVRHDIRRALEHFRKRGANHVSKTEKDIRPGTDFHLFDRRRIHFLKYGQMDQGRIGQVSPKLFQVLCQKSRDEIEQYFMNEERILKEHEFKNYVFVIFDMQKHFSEGIAKTMPQGLNQEKVDEFFMEEICLIKGDSGFWAGMDVCNGLHEYLIRYVTMFFDNDYGRSTYLEEMIQNWINSRRDYNPPKKKQTASMKEAVTIFGISESELRTMGRQELARLYRRKARELHPDQGGDAAAFIRLTEVYQEFRERKQQGFAKK
ncbi:MAG: J domain-containing protein [Desulfococcaceae bacterium]